MRRKRNKGNYAFIDSQNVNVSVQNYGWKMNWRKLREFLSEKHGVTKAFMFIGYMPENEDLYEKMHEAGFAVVLKPTYDMSRPYPNQPQPAQQGAGGEQPNPENGSPRPPVNGETTAQRKPVKGNVDADLVLWAMKEMPNYNKAIIVSGDGDFHSLVEYLHQQGKLQKLLTPTGQYSSLFHEFEQYIDRLDQHRRELAYYDKKKILSRNKQ